MLSGYESLIALLNLFSCPTFELNGEDIAVLFPAGGEALAHPPQTGLVQRSTSNGGDGRYLVHCLLFVQASDTESHRKCAGCARAVSGRAM